MFDYCLTVVVHLSLLALSDLLRLKQFLLDLS